MSVKRYTNGADDDQGTILPFMEESPNGDYVEYADYASLKAEVERLTERNKFLEQIDSYLQGANENAYEKRCDELEAEVEELKRMLEASTFGIEFAKEDIKKLEAEIERLTALTTRTIIPNEELQAQVDRLTKAGDELIHGLAPGGSEYSMNENIERWNAAKEGHNMWGVVAPYVVPPCIDKYTAKEGKQSNG